MHWRWRWRAELYKAMRPWTPAQVDEMELWQIAVFLGTDRYTNPDGWEPTEADLARLKPQAPTEPGDDITQMIMSRMGVNPG